MYVNMLLHRGAQPHAKDVFGQTALHHGVRRGLDDVCVRLLENGANPALRDKQGITPYHIALGHQLDDIAAMLLVYMPNRV